MPEIYQGDPPKPILSRGCLWTIGIFLLLGIPLSWLMLFPSMGHPIEVWYLSECRGHFKDLGLALHNYHDHYLTFPPAIVRDEQGRPFLSWRTLVLPYVEQEPAYHAYKFDEPWDSPHNRGVLKGPIEVFACPFHFKELKEPTTSYVAVIGPNTVWRSDGTTVSAKDITDGMSNTILLVETRNAGIHILEPRDLSLDQMTLTINSEFGQGIANDHRLKGRPLGLWVLMCDGVPRRLPENLSPEVLYAMLTINGSERIEMEGNEWRLVRE